MGKFAIIKTGGKQYKIKEKDNLKIEKIKGEIGDTISFSDALLVVDNEKIEVGTPVLKNRKVEAKILEQGRDKKITVIKYKPKTRYKRKRGHRQPYTKVEIMKI